MGKTYTDVCQHCGKVFTASKIASVQNICANHEDRCPDNPDNTISDSGPSLEEALENARRELGDW